MTASAHFKPLPKIDLSMKPFWDAARRHELAVQQCGVCGHVQFPPGPVCQQCLSDGPRWIAASGRGTLFSWCEFHRGYWDSVMGGLPYNVSMVKIEEGPILVTNLVGFTPEDLRLDRPVKVTFQDIPNDLVLPVFAPA